jgi:long-chain fatty acid transport protein
MRLPTFSEEDDMSGMKRNVVLALAVAAAVAAPGAFATTGYFSHGYSIKEKGLAGGGSAYAQDSLAAATNPAGMVTVGNRMDLGASLFSPIRSYTSTGGPSNACAPTGCTFSIGPQTIDSDNELFLIPHFGRNWMLDPNSSVGISVYGNGGMNTEYKGGTATFFVPPPGPNTFVTAPGTFGGGMMGDSTAGVDLMQLFINGSYSRKMTPTSSWGASLIFAYQRFKATGLSAFGGYSSDPSNLSDNGYDSSTGFGAKLGVQGEVSPGVTLAASYQSEIGMGELDKYKGLFAEGGGFDIPATANIGLAVKLAANSVLTFDMQKIWYSKVNAVGNPFSNLLTGCTPGATGGTGSGCLGASGGGGFGWEDISVYRIGYEWQSNPAWTWRVGFAQNDQPIPSSEVVFNILAPAVQEQHLTFGFTNQVSKASEFNFAFMYSPEEKVSGANPLDPAQTVELKMKQYELGASWGWKF